VNPQFYHGTANCYFQLLQTTVVLELEQGYDLGTVVWQQNEAPPHYGFNIH